MNCTIVICTRNRAESLGRTLAAVTRQRYERGELEILIIDNGSTDHTEQVTETFRQDDPRIRYAVEPTSGLSVARNTGVTLARGEIVAFLDDDAWPLDADWAARLAAVYDDARIAAAGGDVDLEWPSGGRPQWLHAALLPCLGKTNFQLTDVTELLGGHGLWGCNISFRRALILPPRGFRAHLGHVGDAHGAGEEVELCQRLAAAGGRIVYVPGAAMRHAVAADALTPAWFRARGWDHGRADGAIARARVSSVRLGQASLRRLADVVLQLTVVGVLGLAGRQRLRLWSQYRLRYSLAYLLHLVGR